jgi:hypothetical protein
MALKMRTGPSASHIGKVQDKDKLTPAGNSQNPVLRGEWSLK